MDAATEVAYWLREFTAAKIVGHWRGWFRYYRNIYPAVKYPWIAPLPLMAAIVWLLVWYDAHILERLYWAVFCLFFTWRIVRFLRSFKSDLEVFRRQIMAGALDYRTLHPHVLGSGDDLPEPIIVLTMKQLIVLYWVPERESYVLVKVFEDGVGAMLFPRDDPELHVNERYLWWATTRGIQPARWQLLIND